MIGVKIETERHTHTHRQREREPCSFNISFSFSAFSSFRVLRYSSTFLILLPSWQIYIRKQEQCHMNKRNHLSNHLTNFYRPQQFCCFHEFWSIPTQSYALFISKTFKFEQTNETKHSTFHVRTFSSLFRTEIIKLFSWLSGDSSCRGKIFLSGDRSWSFALDILVTRTCRQIPSFYTSHNYAKI